ncbi:MAG: purine-nucleoside phosphorylase [Defluviitaleaceae bacterium]|nr:purine-nucleoside phosphorylase [Defluviitaleaceae bacterium]
MPGDPLRAKFIAENYLDERKEVNCVRGMLGYTGKYKDRPVSVQGSGMGMPSMGIYSYELFNFYGVESIIRVGSAGAISTDLDVGDIVVGIGACTDSNYASSFNLPGSFAPIASHDLVESAVNSAKAQGIKLTLGNLLSTDVFYSDDADAMKAWLKMGVLAVEMEAAALYMNAARSGKKALCVCTISDTIFTGKALSAIERQNSFTRMMELALGMI